jgi:hypothetical protein
LLNAFDIYSNVISKVSECEIRKQYNPMAESESD